MKASWPWPALFWATNVKGEQALVACQNVTLHEWRFWMLSVSSWLESATGKVLSSGETVERRSYYRGKRCGEQSYGMDFKFQFPGKELFFYGHLTSGM
jgi:hypothetical protein